MHIKVGDVVTVKSYDDIKKMPNAKLITSNCGYEDGYYEDKIEFTEFNKNGEETTCVFVENMRKFCGNSFKVAEVDNKTNFIYLRDLDNANDNIVYLYSFFESMLDNFNPNPIDLLEDCHVVKLKNGFYYIKLKNFLFNSSSKINISSYDKDLNYKAKSAYSDDVMDVMGIYEVDYNSLLIESLSAILLMSMDEPTDAMFTKKEMSRMVLTPIWEREEVETFSKEEAVKKLEELLGVKVKIND